MELGYVLHKNSFQYFLQKKHRPEKYKKQGLERKKYVQGSAGLVCEVTDKFTGVGALLVQQGVALFRGKAQGGKACPEQSILKGKLSYNAVQKGEQFCLAHKVLSTR